MFAENDLQAVYFKELTIENIKCFKGKHTIDFSTHEGKPAQWTVLIGENNTGKTTVLRCLARLQPVFEDRSIAKGCYSIKCDFPYNRMYSSLFKNNFLIPEIDKNRIWGVRQKEIAIFRPWINDYLYLNAYGTTRFQGDKTLIDNQDYDKTETLFNKEARLNNIEEWLMRTFLAIKNGENGIKEKAEKVYKKIEEIFISGVFPEVTKPPRITTNEKLQTYVEFYANDSWVRLDDLGSGYQATITWMVDLAKRMFERYPDVENPLTMPAVVLVDEIDLHLHPKWQRQAIDFISNLFPNTQFIVTSHSPLVVQSAKNINVVLLEKEGDKVKIHQPKITNFQGWSVEEILSELMGLGDKTHSDRFLELMQQFDEALAEDDYEKAKGAYKEIEEIVPENSVVPKSLRLQMASLIPQTV